MSIGYGDVVVPSGVDDHPAVRYALMAYVEREYWRRRQPSPARHHFNPLNRVCVQCGKTEIEIQADQLPCERSQS